MDLSVLVVLNEFSEEIESSPTACPLDLSRPATLFAGGEELGALFLLARNTLDAHLVGAATAVNAAAVPGLWLPPSWATSPDRYLELLAGVRFDFFGTDTPAHSQVQTTPELWRTVPTPKKSWLWCHRARTADNEAVRLWLAARGLVWGDLEATQRWLDHAASPAEAVHACRAAATPHR